VIISEYDCGTADGIYVGSIVEAGDVIEALRDRIVGRVSLEKIKDYEGNVIVDINQEITEDLSWASRLPASSGSRSAPCSPRIQRGVCVKCYGRTSPRAAWWNSASGRRDCGAVHRRAGTQLTMRTFHVGGTASRVSEQSRQEAKNTGTVRFINLQRSVARMAACVMNRNGSIVVLGDKGREKERYAVVYGAHLKVSEGDAVKLGQTLLEWDPYTFSIITEIGGAVAFKDLIEGTTLQEEVDEVTGLSRHVVMDSPDEKRQPALVIKGAKGNKRYLMPSRAHLMVQDGDEVSPGDVLAKIPRETTKTKDITGGLPRVVELFEAASRAKPPSSARSMVW